MSEAFKVGDLVRLRNPWGPVMTVTVVHELEPRVFVNWFGADSSLHREWFLVESLEMAPPA